MRMDLNDNHIYKPFDRSLANKNTQINLYQEQRIMSAIRDTDMRKLYEVGKVIIPHNFPCKVK
jgi:hypothetical protein